MSDLTTLTLTQTLKGLESKEFTKEDLNKSYLGKINSLNSSLNIFLEVENNSNGIPAGIKDVFSTKNINTTAGSKILSNYIPPYNATAVEKLLDQGVSVIGKTNCDEFAMGTSGENSAFGVTKNPWDISKIPGGSSSGSAAAVAADMCVFALGTDTGGSIRQPASLCGVVGLKTTYGRISRYGVIPMASSLDTVGHFTKSIEDASLVLEWLSGADKMDSNTHDSIFKAQKLKDGVRGLKLGVPKEYFGEGLDPKVKEVVQKAIKKLEELGAEIVEISLPNTEYALATYYIIVPSEVSSNLARFDGIRFGSNREDFGEEVKRRIMLGTYALSAGYFDEYYSKAAKVRTLVIQDFKKVFEKVDAIVGPVSPTVAWDLGAKVNDPLSLYLADVYTVAANLAGIPGLSVPAGFADGLPVGLQILGKHFDEETILRIGYAFEQATDFAKVKPKL